MGRIIFDERNLENSQKRAITWKMNIKLSHLKHLLFKMRKNKRPNYIWFIKSYWDNMEYYYHLFRLPISLYKYRKSHNG